MTTGSRRTQNVGITHKVRENRYRREAAEHQERLDKISAQLAAGTLTIRRMTAEEREFYGPPKPVDPKLKAQRRRRTALAVPYADAIDFVHAGETSLEEDDES